MPLIQYNLSRDDKSWKYFKEGYMAKITYLHDDNTGESESFWVWIDKIDKLKEEYVLGIISNTLTTFNKPHRPNMKIGDLITFEKNCIKEIANRYYTKEETLFAIENSKENPITKYFESLNIRFTSY